MNDHDNNNNHDVKSSSDKNSSFHTVDLFCKICKERNNLNYCSSCRDSIYCSQKCQAEDYTIHEPECETIQQYKRKLKKRVEKDELLTNELNSMRLNPIGVNTVGNEDCDLQSPFKEHEIIETLNDKSLLTWRMSGSIERKEEDTQSDEINVHIEATTKEKYKKTIDFIVHINKTSEINGFDHCFQYTPHFRNFSANNMMTTAHDSKTLEQFFVYLIADLDMNTKFNNVVVNRVVDVPEYIYKSLSSALERISYFIDSNQKYEWKTILFSRNYQKDGVNPRTPDDGKDVSTVFLKDLQLDATNTDILVYREIFRFTQHFENETRNLKLLLDIIMSEKNGFHAEIMVKNAQENAPSYYRTPFSKQEGTPYTILAYTKIVFNPTDRWEFSIPLYDSKGALHIEGLYDNSSDAGKKRTPIDEDVYKGIAGTLLCRSIFLLAKVYSFPLDFSVTLEASRSLKNVSETDHKKMQNSLVQMYERLGFEILPHNNKRSYRNAAMPMKSTIGRILQHCAANKDRYNKLNIQDKPTSESREEQRAIKEETRNDSSEFLNGNKKKINTKKSVRTNPY